MADDTTKADEAKIRETYFSLRQRAERQALAEYTEYSSAPSRQAVINYQEVIGRVTGSGDAQSIATSSRWFSNPLPDANKDGRISAGEMEALENFERGQLVGAALVMNRVNELIQNPEQISSSATRMSYSAIQERFKALSDQHETKASLRDYISQGLQTGYAQVERTENARVSALAEQERIRTTPPQIETLESGNTRVTTADGKVREFTPQQIEDMQALRTAQIVMPNGSTPAQAVAETQPAAATQRSGSLLASVAQLGRPLLAATIPSAVPMLDAALAQTAANAPAPANGADINTPDNLAQNAPANDTQALISRVAAQGSQGLLYRGVHRNDPDAKIPVEELQRGLKELGHYAGEIDGQFGPLTFAAVQAFQRDNGLESSGIAGKETVAALQIMQVAQLPAEGVLPAEEALAKAQKETAEAYAAIGNFSGIVPDSIKNMMTVSGLELQTGTEVRLASTPAGAAPAPSSERG